MDERADYGVSESDYGGAVQSPSPSDDSLTTRLAELRAQLEVLAPPDQARGLETIEEIRHAQERIGTLELMLARAREREDSLTAQSVREQSTIADGETRIAELTAIAAQLPASEAALREAEITIAETKKQLTQAQAESEARQAEVERLRARVAELEAEVAAVAVESVSAAVARAEVARAERELTEARDRAYTERRLAAADRRRAAEADLRTIDMHHQLRLAERKLAQLTNTPEPSRQEEEARPSSDNPWPTVSTDADILDLTNEPLRSVDPDVIHRAEFCFPLLDEIERVRWGWRLSGRSVRLAGGRDPRRQRHREPAPCLRRRRRQGHRGRRRLGRVAAGASRLTRGRRSEPARDVRLARARGEERRQPVRIHPERRSDLRSGSRGRRPSARLERLAGTEPGAAHSSLRISGEQLDGARLPSSGSSSERRRLTFSVAVRKGRRSSDWNTSPIPCRRARARRPSGSVEIS